MLTTKEFINLMQNSGYYVSLNAEEIDITTDDGIVATVDTEEMFMFDTINKGFYELSKVNQKYVYDKLKEYSETPIESREGE